MKKFLFFMLLLLSVFVFSAPLAADEAEKNAAAGIGMLLSRDLAPESVEVTAADGGKTAWIIVKGTRIAGVRIDEMKLLARLKSAPKNAAAAGKRALAELVESSVGEIVLQEKDVNDYYKNGAATSGFSGLTFDFRPQGFKAEGDFELQLLMNMKLHLAAEGRLGVRQDGLCLEDVVIYAAGLRQPDGLARYITDKINPLLPFSSIPFPVTLTRVTMTDAAAVVTGGPTPLQRGERWSWRQ